MTGLSLPKHCLLFLSAVCATLEGGVSWAQPVESTFTLPPLEEFSAIVERPLFSPDRRPVAAPAKPGADSAQTDSGTASQILLSGTATDQGNRAVAILHDITLGTQFRVWVGDQVGGWTILAIKPREIVLENAKRQVTVTLDEPALPEPAVGR